MKPITAETVQETVTAIRRVTKLEPQAAIILGTGLGALSKEIAVEASIPYEDIPGFVRSTVETHSGKLLFGTLEGKKVVAMSGRFHRYEGYTLQEINFPVRVMSALCAKILLVSNAAGGINRRYDPGDLMLIEDSCEAIGATLNGRAAGSFGECGVFAFYPNKQITAGEGGMIVTDRDDIRDMCVSLRNQGRASEAWLSHARLGYNYRLSELQATVGLTQIKRLDHLLARRAAAANLYNQALADIPQIHLPPMSLIENPSWFVYVIRLSDEFSQANRDAIIQRLTDNGIGCSNYFVPIHTKPYIKDSLGTAGGDFPVTERIAARTIALPFFGGLSGEQVDRVRDSLVKAIAATD